MPNEIPMQEFFEKRDRVWVAIRPMTKEEARKAYLNRPESKYAETLFGGNNMTNDSALLLGGEATYCNMCQAPTVNKHLREGICPDCDGRSQKNGRNPHVKE